MDDNNDRELLDKTYPSNSRTKKLEPVAKGQEKKIEKVVTGVVKQQKQGLGRKIMEFLFEDDTRSVGQYIVHDVLLPAAKAALSDMVGGGLDMLLFGERRGSRTRREGGRSYVSYGSYYRQDDRDRNRDRGRDSRDRDYDRRDISRQGRVRHDFKEIVFDNRGDAEEVLSHMVDLVADYGMVSVSDFYELVGVEANFTDNKYGWTDLHDAFTERVRDGYLINLPRTQTLD